jgi:hypothetical protein
LNGGGVMDERDYQAYVLLRFDDRCRADGLRGSMWLSRRERANLNATYARYYRLLQLALADTAEFKTLMERIATHGQDTAR